jgi:mono/diheme cytochrome c family protein
MLKKMAKSCGGFILSIALLLICVPPARTQGEAEATFKAKCAGCHGADGSANTPAAKTLGVRDFQSPEVQKETDAELVDIITKGKNKMPKYGDKLKDSEIKDLVGYVRALGKKK